jgi:hypothetical protein
MFRRGPWDIHDMTADPVSNATHSTPVGGPPTGPTADTKPIVAPDRLADALLLIYADALDDIEAVRIANENRVRALRDAKGMADTPEEARLSGLVDALRSLEHGAELELKRALRKHPLGGWVRDTVGVGEKQGARLLAAIGWPGDRAMVSQLWSYAGYGVVHPGDRNGYDTQDDLVAGGAHPVNDAHDRHATPATPDHSTSDTQQGCVGERYGWAPRRRRGVRSSWNPAARMRAYLVAESCIKHRSSPYRAVYDDGRAKYADAVHRFPCVRCGPSGSPAPVGSPLNDGHKHARALRLVAKAVLRDLWVEAKRIDAKSMEDTDGRCKPEHHGCR